MVHAHNVRHSSLAGWLPLAVVALSPLIIAATVAILLSLLGIEADAIGANLKRQAIVWGAIGALGLVMVAFLLVALNGALAASFGPVVAPLIIAVAAGVIAVAVFLVAHIHYVLFGGSLMTIFGGLIVLTQGSAVAPFIYSLF